MKSLSLLLLSLLAALELQAAEPVPEPFRILPTPTGCAVVFDGVSDEYRVDTLVDGGVTIALYNNKIAALERQLTGGCLASELLGQSKTEEQDKGLPPRE